MSDVTPVLFVQAAEKYLKEGVRVEEVFNLSRRLLLLNKDDPEMLFEFFLLFHEYGMDEREIDTWIAVNAGFSVIEDIVDNEEKWRRIGIWPNDYVDRYLAWRQMRHDYSYLE